MEDIALTALPREIDSDNSDSGSVISTNLGSQESSKPLESKMDVSYIGADISFRGLENEQPHDPNPAIETTDLDLQTYDGLYRPLARKCNHDEPMINKEIPLENTPYPLLPESTYVPTIQGKFQAQSVLPLK